MAIHCHTAISVKLHLLLSLFLFASLLTQANGQTEYYLDLNYNSQGYGSGPANYTWSHTATFWNSNGNPLNFDTPVGWVDGSTATISSSTSGTVSGTVVVADMTISGLATISGGTINFAGNPSTVKVYGGTTKPVDIGSILTSTNAVTIDQGAQENLLNLTGASTFAGGLNAFKGTTAYTGSGASLNTGSANITIGGTYGSTLNFTNGADLIEAFRITAGAPSGTGTLNFSGAGTTANVTQYIWLGIQSGTTGTMNITDGAAVSTGTTVSVGDVVGSPGYLTVSGTGSTLAATGNIYVSYDSYGSAIFNSGATISTGANFYVASNPTGDADLTIDGTGTTLTIANDLITATNHGSATTTSTSTSNITISNNATVTVNGTVLLADLAGAADTMTLSTGGTLIVSDQSEQDGIRSGAGGSTFHLAGGTLKVRNDIDSTLTTYVPMTLSNASTIDTNASSANLNGILYGNGSLIKVGDGTLYLDAANTYTGSTTIENGTLLIRGMTQATSAIEVASGATLGLDIGLPIAAANATVTLGGTVLVDSTPTEPSHTLLTANSITGTPVLAAAVPGYQLQVVGGNELRLVQTVGTPYEIWAGGEPFDGDANGDGVPNSIAFLLGATDPDVNALTVLPAVNESGGSLVMTFSMRNAASRGDAALHLQHSSDLGIDDPWTTIPIPETSGTTGGVTFTIIPGSPLNSVTATIAPSESTNGKLFSRLEGATP